MERWNRLAAYGALGLAMLILGSGTVANKIAVGAFPVFFATEGRLLLSCLLQLGLLKLIHEPFPYFSPSEKKTLFLQALLGVFLYSICFMVGLKHTSALEGGIFSSFIPAAGGILSVVLFRERLGWNQHAGILLTILGTLFINVWGVLGGGGLASSHLMGNLLILLSSFCQAVFVTFGKLLPGRIHFLALGAAVSGIGAAMFFPFALYDLMTFDFSAASPLEWGTIFYNGLACTGLGVMLMNYANRKLSAVTVSVFTSFTPVSAILLSCLVLGDKITWFHLLGGLVIFLGVGFSLLPTQRSTKEPLETASQS